MARPKNTVPSYCLHSASNSARCWVAGRWVNPGKYNSPESRAEHARILAEHAVSPDRGHTVGLTGITLNQLLLGFWRYADQYYRRPDGTPINELPQFKQTGSDPVG